MAKNIVCVFFLHAKIVILQNYVLQNCAYTEIVFDVVEMIEIERSTGRIEGSGGVGTREFSLIAL